MRLLDRLRSMSPIAWVPRDRSRLVLTVGAVLYTTRVIASGWRTGFPSFFPDSSSYVAVSHLGPFDPSFWWSERPIGVPLALWLTGGNHRLFFAVQTVLFAMSLAFLCSVLLKAITARWLGWITCAAVASIAVHPRFGLWNLEILSESLSFSLSLLLIAVWLRFAMDPAKRHLIGALAVTIAWMSVRDVHIVTGAVIAGALIVSAIARRPWHLRRTALVGSAVLLAFSSYLLIAQGSSNRNLYPLINNIGERVLPNTDVLGTFTDRKMPLDAALRERTGDDTWSDDQAFLRSAELAEFRAWAEAHGQQALLTSFVVDAPFWIDTTRSAIDASLPLDFTEYDRHGTSDRLPTRLFWFQGPRAPWQFASWAGAAGLALVALLAGSRYRRTGLIAGCAFIAVGADLFVSACGDSVEVQRHLLGPVLRASLLFVVVCALGAQALIERATRIRTRDAVPVREPMSVSASVATALGSVAVFGTWIALEHRSQDFDPQYVRTVIERAARYGGSYYANGIHNKGPIETVLYDSVRLFTNYDTYWFGISTYIVLASIILGLTAGKIAAFLGASRRVVISAGVVVCAHFALSDSDYAGVLYSRNITTTILAVAVGVTLWDAPWRKPVRATMTYIGLAILLGLAIQTLLTTIFAAFVVGTFVFVRRSATTALRRPAVTAIATASATVATAPIWYALRGSLAEFWSSWWTYAGFMSSSTGRSLLNQIGLGAQKMFGYYQERPFLVLLFAAYALLLRRQWNTLSTGRRTVHVMSITWLVAGWIELVLSQRYSSHYFSVVAVPTVFIAVACATLILDTLGRRDSAPAPRPALVPGRTSWWATIACVLAVLAVQGTQLTWIAVEGAGSFRSTAHYVQSRSDARSGSQLTQQAVMDLVSADDDPLLAWTMYPWTYLDHRRVPATRFSWKSFLIGEIYLGRTSPRYVLDRTWEWFADDLRESQPRVYARPLVTELKPPTPMSTVVADEFTTVFTDEDLEIGWRNDLFTAATEPTRTPIDISALPSGWVSEQSDTSVTAAAGAAPWELPLAPCQRVSLSLVRASPADPTGVTFRFESPSRSVEPVGLGIGFDRSWSERDNLDDPDPPVELDAIVLADNDLTELDVVLVVTRSAAALLVDGHVVSAVPLADPTKISLVPYPGGAAITRPTVGTLSSFTGC